MDTSRTELQIENNRLQQVDSALEDMKGVLCQRGKMTLKQYQQIVDLAPSPPQSTSPFSPTQKLPDKDVAISTAQKKKIKELNDTIRVLRAEVTGRCTRSGEYYLLCYVGPQAEEDQWDRFRMEWARVKAELRDPYREAFFATFEVPEAQWHKHYCVMIKEADESLGTRSRLMQEESELVRKEA
ncbi:MAG: hypothetical protein SGARI_007284 [Bacillariaceae sp.]